MTDRRSEYRRTSLDEGDVDPDPLVQLQRWLDEAAAAGLDEPDAMVLATADSDGRPSARTVLLRGVDHRGLRFFTNRGSRKGGQLAGNPACSALFPWYGLERQVEVAGRAELLPDEESDAYFASRPKASRLASISSAQSTVIPDRSVLEARLAELEVTYAKTDRIPRPDHWGGFVLVPRTVELWQGRPARLHDRLRYSRTSAGGWSLERLSP